MPPAFRYPDIKAVIASIGGEDELKGPRAPRSGRADRGPKPFFGYSDNTNLHLFLWNLGLVSYLGGSIMVQFGWPVAMHPVSRLSLERAMFTRGGYRLEPPASYCDEEGDWAVASTLATEPRSFSATAWSWHGPPLKSHRPRAAARHSQRRDRHRRRHDQADRCDLQRGRRDLPEADVTYCDTEGKS